jgi:metal-responsive CopG/Arc/MetJ family transcriptional regulator
MSYMKTAISIDEDLFRKAEKLSSKLQVSRSQLFAQALEYLIERSETLEVIQRLNEVYGHKQPDDEAISKASKRKIRKVIDKW